MNKIYIQCPNCNDYKQISLGFYDGICRCLGCNHYVLYFGIVDKSNLVGMLKSGTWVVAGNCFYKTGNDKK